MATAHGLFCINRILSMLSFAGLWRMKSPLMRARFERGLNLTNDGQDKRETCLNRLYVNTLNTSLSMFFKDQRMLCTVYSLRRCAKTTNFFIGCSYMRCNNLCSENSSFYKLWDDLVDVLLCTCRPSSYSSPLQIVCFIAFSSIILKGRIPSLTVRSQIRK